MSRVIPSPFRVENKITRDSLTKEFLLDSFEGQDYKLTYIIGKETITLPIAYQTLEADGQHLQVQGITYPGPSQTLTWTDTTTPLTNTYQTYPTVSVRAHRHDIATLPMNRIKGSTSITKDQVINKFLEVISKYVPDISAVDLRKLENSAISYDRLFILQNSYTVIIEETMSVDIDNIYTYLIKKI